MNIKRFIINSIVGLILFNAAGFLVATLRHVPFGFNFILGFVAPIAAGFASGIAQTPEERQKLQ